MSSRPVTPRRTRFTIIGLVALTSLVAASTDAHASVEDQRRRVEQIADELDRIANRVGELDDQHGAALDRQEALNVEIAQSQARVAEQESQVGAIEEALREIAVSRYMSGGSLGLSPLLANAGDYAESQQRSVLSQVALDLGTSDVDELEAVLNDLQEERASLDRKMEEAAQLIQTLETSQTEAEQLEAEYQTMYASAQAELGNLIQEEQERRSAEAYAQAQAQLNAAAAAAPSATLPPRGGGGNSGSGGGGSSGGNSGGGGGGGGGSTTPTPTPTPTPQPPPSSPKAGTAVSAAMGQQGVPYKFAASSPGVAFDCSGLTKFAWGQAGVYLPHQSRAQFASTPHVPKDQAQPGDLIFYYSPISHVGIYLGGGQLIHAPATGDVVKIAAVNWNKVVGVSRPG